MIDLEELEDWEPLQYSDNDLVDSICADLDDYYTDLEADYWISFDKEHHE